MLTEGDGAVPIDCAVEPGIVAGKRIGDDMGRGESDAVKLAGCALGKVSWLRTDETSRSNGRRAAV